jgi:hypothetical protein
MANLVEARLKVDHRGRKLEDVVKEINVLKNRLNDDMTIVAEKAANFLKKYINSRRKRRSVNIKSITDAFDIGTVKRSKDELYIGIGNTAELNRRYKYWKVLNYGGYTPPPNRGFFDGAGRPSRGGSRQGWYHTGSKSDFLMIPKKPIEGIHYLEETQRIINKYFKNMRLTLK